MGQSPPSSAYNTRHDGLPFFQGKAEFTELHPVTVKWCTAPTKIAEINDILLSVRALRTARNLTLRDLTQAFPPMFFRYIVCHYLESMVVLSCAARQRRELWRLS